MTKIIAHRGSSGDSPENTMYAFRKAIADGADCIETDVRKTKDGVLVLMHDASLKRVAHDEFANVNVVHSTYSEIKDIDISSENYPELPVQHIVKLSEVLELIKETGIEFNLEIKPSHETVGRLEYDVVEMVRQYGVEDKILYSCFDHTILKSILTLNPDARVAPLYIDSINNIAQYAKALGACAVHPECENVLLHGNFKAVREAGIDINVWTVNHSEDAKALVKAGATGLITNFPAKIRKAVENM